MMNVSGYEGKESAKSTSTRRFDSIRARFRFPRGNPFQVLRRSTASSALLALLAFPGVVAADIPPAPPNLLLLVAEDLSPRIGAFGDPVSRTPHLDALAAEGVRYDRVFTTAGVCAPSRAALVTGRHAISFGAQHMRTSSRPAGGYATVPPPDLVAFPERLRAAGYYTYTDAKLDYQFSGVMAGSGPASLWDDEGGDAHWRNRTDGRPFFGLVNFQVTHESGVFRPLGSWPHSLTHLAMQLVRAWWFGLDAGQGPIRPEDVVLPPYYPDTPTVRADLARHYDNVHAMDAQVGALLAELEADGLADSTIVVWTTDHGDGLPRAKRELFDAGLRVPMIVRWPPRHRPASAVPGGWDHRLVSFVDLAPTLLELAGVPLPPDLPGRSFADPDAPRREYVFAARDRIDEVLDHQRAVRDDRFKYIRSQHPDLPGGHPLAFRDNIDMLREMRALYEAGDLDAAQRQWFEPPGAERLYDLQADPYELVDLARDPAHAATLARLRDALDAWLARTGDTSEESEDAMAERFWPGGEQPATPPPTLSLRAGHVEIAGVPGAHVEARVDGGSWRLYTGAFPSPPGARVEARAVRYGWQGSEVRELRTPGTGGE